MDLQKNKNTRCAQQQMHAAFVVLFHWAIPPGSKTNIEKFLTARLHIQKLPKIEGLGRVFPTKCWRNDTMNFRGGIEFSFEPHLNEQIWARHNKIGLGAPKLYCFTRDKGIDCTFLHSVLCSTWLQSRFKHRCFTSLLLQVLWASDLCHSTCQPYHFPALTPDTNSTHTECPLKWISFKRERWSISSPSFEPEPPKKKKKRPYFPWNTVLVA